MKTFMALFAQFSFALHCAHLRSTNKLTCCLPFPHNLSALRGNGAARAIRAKIAEAKSLPEFSPIAVEAEETTTRVPMRARSVRWYQEDA
jgi:hypothetical protein